MFGLTAFESFLAVGAAAAAWAVWVVLYRLLFSPLANIPGPKLAAATGLVEVWYDVVQKGQYVFVIEKWHETYGPIIRINPTQVHILDGDFFDELYKLPSNKTERLRYRLNIPHAISELPDAGEHKARRSGIGPLFSRQRTLGFEQYIQSRVDKLCAVLMEEFAGTERPVSISQAWSAFTTDTIAWYTMAMSYDFLSSPNFDSPFIHAVAVLQSFVPLFSNFPGLVRIFGTVPESWLAKLSPDLEVVFKFYDEIRSQILRIVNGENDGHKSVAHRTVFHELHNTLGSDKYALQTMLDDGLAITLAGIETTKTALALTTFWILKNPDMLHRLQAELVEAMPDPGTGAPLSELEKLPYLTAVILEGQRMAYGVSGRLARQYSKPIPYGSYHIPPGTEFAMTPALQHRDPKLFPDPHQFHPERWLNNPLGPSGRPLAKHLSNFSAGPRMCLGMHFARAEMYLGLATLFRRMNLELFQTERNAVDLGHDCLVPVASYPTYGVRVTVK